VDALAELQQAAGLLQTGNIAAAADKAQTLLETNATDGNATLQVHLGDLCLQCEMYFEAAKLYEPLWPQNPDDPSLRYKAGTAAYRTGRLGDAMAHFEKCVEVRPDTAASYLQLGHIHRAQRNFEQAGKCYLDYIELASNDKGHGYWSLADLRRHEFGQEKIEAMRRHLDRCDPGGADASIMQFALGKVAEEQGRYGEALEHYRVANGIQKKLRPFLKAAYYHLLDGLKSAGLDAVPAETTDAGRPIFVVGLPRSGSTLVEQILAAHSTVEATDELPYIERIAFRLEREGGYGHRLAALDDTEREAFRKQYLDAARRHLESPDNNFVDKNPNNFLHIGLIRALLPEALIINTRRDLRDNAFSMYRQMFPSGHNYSASFDDIGAYCEGYLQLMRRWEALYPESIMEIDYEDLVTNPEQNINALLMFCRLDEEPGCFEFYKSRQAVMTPSAAQVSQPMYTSSIDHWKNFSEELAPEFERLATLQDAFDS